MSSSRTIGIGVAAALALCLTCAVAPPATAQVAASGPATTQPAGARDAAAVVVKVAGNVRAAPVPDAGGQPQWREVKVGDRLGGGTQIRTALRSSVLLQFGDSTIVKIDRVTSATVAQFYQTAQEQRVKLDLGYGAVRAGVAEGTLQSDMTIETPVATLTRRGTWNFGIEYEAVTGRFRMFVDEHGLIEALNQLTRQRRLVEAGQYVTQAMIRWIETAKFDRQVRVTDMFGLRGDELVFANLFDTGRAVVNPGGGAGLMTPGAGGGATAPGSTPFVPFTPVPPTPGVTDRPEGNFGTGGLVPPAAAKAVRAFRR